MRRLTSQAVPLVQSRATNNCIDKLEDEESKRLLDHIIIRFSLNIVSSLPHSFTMAI